MLLISILVHSMHGMMHTCAKHITKHSRQQVQELELLRHVPESQERPLTRKPSRRACTFFEHNNFARRELVLKSGAEIA